MYSGGGGGLYIIDPKGRKLGRIVHGARRRQPNLWRETHYSALGWARPDSIQRFVRSRGGARKVSSSLTPARETY